MNRQRRKFHFKREILLIFILSAISSILFFTWESPLKAVPFLRIKNTLNLNPLPRNSKIGSTLFDMQKPDKSLPEFHLTIEPEFMASMLAAAPKERTCLRTRFKKVPVKAFKINDSQIKGKVFARLRGLCHLHWLYKQKSIKVQIEEPFLGYSTFNLNSLNTDPYLYEIWSNRLLVEAGGIASRVVLVKVYLNDEYLGVYQLVENLDKDLLANQGLQPGPMYREKFFAEFGNPDEVEAIQDFWQKNTAKESNWEDLIGFQKAILQSVRTGDNGYRGYLNVDQYLTYTAVVALTGTYHLNTHNIPLYRPKRDPRFSFIGYDFYLPEASSTSTPFLPLHTPFGPMNRLSRLFLFDPSIRTMLHKRIAEIIRKNDPADLYVKIAAHARPFLAEDLPKGIIADGSGVNSIEQYEPSNWPLEAVKRRIRYLEDGYYNPSARITPNWREKKVFQLVIQGAGMYRVRLKSYDNSCTSKPSFSVTVLGRAIDSPITCGPDKKIHSEPFIAERNDVYFPAEHVLSSARQGRNTAGAILVEIANDDEIILKDIEIESLQTGAHFQPAKDWPFFIKRIDEGIITLGEDLPPYSANLTDEGYTVFKYEPAPIKFEAVNGTIKVSYYGLKVAPNSDHIGPALCWNLDGNRDCLEITAAMLFSVDPARLFPSYTATGATTKFTLMPNDVKNCKTFTFTKGTWHVPKPVLFGPSCAVTFEPSTQIFFDENALLVIEGPVKFPPDRHTWVEFRPYENEWGGVVIRGQKYPVEVQNARFIGSNEFSFQGRRFTGALNIVDVLKSSVYNCRFFDNNSDDALNIRGGYAKVTNNLFVRNRDALDFDLGSALVEGNFMFRSRDDGIDIGSLKGLIVQNNMIRESGDKGISVGEGSTEITITGNHFEKNNVGVAIKDGSEIFLSGNLFKKNSIGLNVYEKVSDGSKPIIVKGSSWFDGNETSYKERGLSRDISKTEITALPLSADTVKKVDEKISKVCTLCSLNKW